MTTPNQYSAAGLTIAAPATPVIYSPTNLNFGAVRPNTTGPDISVDPSFGPPAISFNGSVQIKSAPVNAMVTAHIAGDIDHFGVRDIIVMEWSSKPSIRASCLPDTRDRCRR